MLFGDFVCFLFVFCGKCCFCILGGVGFGMDVFGSVFVCF